VPVALLRAVDRSVVFFVLAVFAVVVVVVGVFVVVVVFAADAVAAVGFFSRELVGLGMPVVLAAAVVAVLADDDFGVERGK